MSKTTVCVFGVNGVGKSSLLHTVSEMIPGAVVFRGSAILKESLGVASYEALESLSAEEKKRTLIEGMNNLIEKSGSSIAIVDTHLVVPIRTIGKPIMVEDMWDDRMPEFFEGFVYVCASPEIVSCRRRFDNERALRVINSSPQVCAEDLRLNSCKWDKISTMMPKKKVVVNDQSIVIGAEKITRFIQELV